MNGKRELKKINEPKEAKKEGNKKNQCSPIKQTFADYLTGDLESSAADALQSHIARCGTCRRELEELNHTWTQLGVLPEQEPGPNLRKNFYTMLDSYQEGLNKETRVTFKLPKLSLGKIMERIFPRRPAFQVALTMILLVAGFVGGYFFTLPGKGRYNAEMSTLRNQEQQMRQNLTLALLDQESPSQRLKGIQWSATVQEPQPKLLAALLKTLNTDPNVNVRLSAVDALYLFSGNPLVKKGIRESLPNQTSPMVQVALIDLLVQLREKKAVQALKKLMENEKLNPEVKEHAKALLDKLI